jgi:predicted ATPase
LCLLIVLGALDRLGEPALLLSEPRAESVVALERLDELHGVVADDRADRRAVGRGTLEQVGEVVEHLLELVAVARAGVHQVPLNASYRRAIAGRKLLHARLVRPPALLVFERARDQLDPSCGHDYSPSPCGCPI